MSVLRALIAGAAIGTSVWALIAYAASRPPVCAPMRGGSPGAQTQMQHLYVGDRSVTFAFVNSTLGKFDTPSYAAQRESDGSVLLTFQGASTLQPDGTPSYAGPTKLAAPQLGEEVSLVDDGNRAMRWRIAADPNVCPRVSTLRYWTGSYSKALVIVTFGDVSTLTLEQTARPAKAPIWVNGSGFAAGRSVTITAAGETLRETTADRAGMFSSAIYTPDASPGEYVVVARDDAGHRAQTTLTVLPGLWP